MDKQIETKHQKGLTPPGLALIDLSRISFRIEHEPPLRIGALPRTTVPTRIYFWNDRAYAWTPLAGVHSIRVTESLLHGKREMAAWVLPEFYNGPPELLERKPVESSPKE